MDMVALIQEYVMPIVVGICLCIGYILKNVIPTDKINKYIPLVMGLIGLILASWISGWTITPQVIFSGLISGLASTGLYEMFRNILEKAEW